MPKKSVPQEIINHAVEVINQGGVVVFPTDTAYGLGCDFENQSAIERIKQIKNRRDDKFTIIVSSLAQAALFFPSIFLSGTKGTELAERYWPGALSIVVNDSFSVRVPDCETARMLAEQVGKPIIATSANKTGNKLTYTLEAAQQELGAENADCWIDGGELSEQPPSTIVRIDYDKVEVIRAGSIKL